MPVDPEKALPPTRCPRPKPFANMLKYLKSRGYHFHLDRPGLKLAFE